MINGFYQLILKRLQERTNLHAQTLCSGAVKSFEDYRHISGKLRGVEEAEGIIRAAYKDVVESVLRTSNGLDVINTGD